jgi:hypothetical protein
VPADWKGQRLLLHFGAVDWHARVLVNNKQVGEHKGGYVPFSFDITSAIPAGASECDIVVVVKDPTDAWTQPRGKQTREPSGIWYTSVSGIWQTVWIEPVPTAASISRVVPVPDIDRGEVRVVVETHNPAAAGVTVQAVAYDGGAEVGRATGAAGTPLAIAIPKPTLWSPENPHLYSLRVTLLSGGSQEVDRIGSYFAMRKTSIGSDQFGRTRMMLNNKPYFQLGPLDQGWWPDGLYTAPTDEALRFDVEYTKRIGMNMIRKHVKVEPARWYYHCDRLGMLVWQDMPNGNLQPNQPNNLRVEPNGPDAKRPADSAKQFEAELAEMIRALEAVPSIVAWVPFNEGWGQYDTARIAALTRKLDPTRIVNAVSGWTDRNVGDIRDVHHYPGPALEDAGPGRAAVLGEFGGVSMPVKDHLWVVTNANWGYATTQQRDELFAYYQSLFTNMRALLAQGMSAAIYTQTTDVESEVNGYLTYDRAVEKFDTAALNRLHAEMYKTVAPGKVLVPDSRQGTVPWRYSSTEPTGDWQQPQFSDAQWQTGSSTFGTGSGGAFTPRTAWSSERIWLRHTFSLDKVPSTLSLSILNGFNEAEVFLNGASVLRMKDVRPARRHHTHFDLTKHAGLLREGDNVIAIYARQPARQRFVDAGLYGHVKP